MVAEDLKCMQSPINTRAVQQSADLQQRAPVPFLQDQDRHPKIV